MHPIRKKILTDDAMRPLAIQIDYADWLEIERLLNAHGEAPSSSVPATPATPQGQAGDGLWPLRGSVSRYDDPFAPAANVLNCPLVTGDAKILRYPHVESVGPGE